MGWYQWQRMVCQPDPDRFVPRSRRLCGLAFIVGLADRILYCHGHASTTQQLDDLAVCFCNFYANTKGKSGFYHLETSIHLDFENGHSYCYCSYSSAWLQLSAI